MENQLLEMMGKLLERMDAMESRIENGFAEVNTRLTVVNNKLDALLPLVIPEEEATPEEMEAIERGRAEFERGEVYSMDEVFSSIDKEEGEA